MEVKKRGRPRVDDPKIKLDNVRLKTSTVIDIEVISDKVSVSPSMLIQTLIENEMPKLRKLLDIEEN